MPQSERRSLYSIDMIASESRDSSDGSSDDSWYRQMEEAAPGEASEDDEDSDRDIMKKAGFLLPERDDDGIESSAAEDRYFESILQLNISQAEASPILPEENLVWQVLTRDLSAMYSISNTHNIPAPSEDTTGANLQLGKSALHRVDQLDVSSLLIIQQYLFSHLPHSSRVFRYLAACTASSAHEINSPSMASTIGLTPDSSLLVSARPPRQRVWVDNLQHPSIVVSYDCSFGSEQCEFSVFSSIMPPESDLLRELCELMVSTSRKKCAFAGTLESTPCAPDAEEGDVAYFTVTGVEDVRSTTPDTTACTGNSSAGGLRSTNLHCADTASSSSNNSSEGDSSDAYFSAGIHSSSGSGTDTGPSDHSSISGNNAEAVHSFPTENKVTVHLGGVDAYLSELISSEMRALGFRERYTVDTSMFTLTVSPDSLHRRSTDDSLNTTKRLSVQPLLSGRQYSQSQLNDTRGEKVTGFVTSDRLPEGYEFVRFR
jgi:hypothetical protein